MVLLLMNAGVFVVIGSLLSRLHVLQEWMGISYTDFSWILFSFSCGAVISNLVGGQLIRWQGPKRILSLAMACIVLSLCGFLEKPSYAGLIALWTLFSFGFGTSMIILFSQAGTLQNQQEKGWMSFYQGIGGVGVILGMGFGWLANSHHFPLDLHFPLVGFGLALCMVFLIRAFEPLHQDQSEESAPFRITFTLVLLGCINFFLLLSVSQVITWSGILLRDKFQFKDAMAGFGSLGFLVTETGVRFVGDRLKRRLGSILLLAGGGTLCAVSLLVVFTFQYAPAALFGMIGAGLFSGTIQPTLLSLCSLEKGNIAKNMAFVLLFQSLAFLVGPILSGTIAEQVGLFEIYLFSSLMSFMIVLFSVSFARWGHTTVASSSPSGDSRGI